MAFRIFEKYKIKIDKFTKSSVYHTGFLTHIHSDHTRGLENTKCRCVYTTKQTKNLLRLQEKYTDVNFKCLDNDRIHRIDDCFSIVVIDSNHCTGSCMFIFLFHVIQTNVLYTGDFRMSKLINANPLLLETNLRYVLYDDTLENIPLNFPSYEETYQMFKKKITLLQRQYGLNVTIHISSFILGFELLLLRFHQETKQYFSISSCLPIIRKNQLKFILNQSLKPHAVLKLDNHKYKKKNQLWIIPTSTYFICKYPINSQYIWFSCHAHDKEIEEFKNLVGNIQTEFIPCDFSLLPLKCKTRQ